MVVRSRLCRGGGQDWCGRHDLPIQLVDVPPEHTPAIPAADRFASRRAVPRVVSSSLLDRIRRPGRAGLIGVVRSVDDRS
jgi:hypothetical protein